jgi:hypothetical protein
MTDIKIERGTKLIKVLAAQNQNERIDSDQIEKANSLISELLEDLNPQTCHKIGQIVAYTVEELQNKALDFLGAIADEKNINYGEKAAFRVRTDGIHAYVQAKGAITARSYITDRQLLVGTKEISARPAINIVDLKANRFSMADLIKEANAKMLEKKLEIVENVLQAGFININKSPWYAKSVGGLNPTTLDQQVTHFRRLGPVTLLGDIAAVGQLDVSAGMQVNATPTWSYSGNMLDQHNDNGHLGRWHGADVVGMTNAYKEDGVTPVLNPNWIYIIPGAQSADMRNLKIVNEGGINSMANQNIDDRVTEILLYTWFGAAFVVGKNPTAGAHELA